MAECGLPPLIRALCQPRLHGGAGGGVRVVETHISWVLLDGRYAYKIKKPVNFGFLDFSRLEDRRHYCEEEVRLNRRFAPLLYEGVVAITGDKEHPQWDGQGPVLEYAVKLRQFDEANLADRLLASDLLGAEAVDGLAELLATFHGQAERATEDHPHGTVEAILATAEQSFEQLSAIFPEQLEVLQGLRDWTRSEFTKLHPVFQGRQSAGFIRECHGDLHCGNLVLLEGSLVPFDCIEFNADLRWIDCASELAFIVMDLEVRGRADLAWRLLNRYLEASGDYAGLAVFNFYRVYRALVRAKIVGLTLAGTAAGDERGVALAEQARGYLEYALRVARGSAPVLLMTYGLSGSGKSTLARCLLECLPAIRLASDVERKRLAGLAALADSGSPVDGGIYSEAMGRQTYARLLELAEAVLQAGFNVILDATYLQAARRAACRALARRLGVRYFILAPLCPVRVLRGRIARRSLHGGDPSEAGYAVLEAQMHSLEPLEAIELADTLVLDMSALAQLDSLSRQIKSQIGLTLSPRVNS